MKNRCPGAGVFCHPIVCGGGGDGNQFMGLCADTTIKGVSIAQTQIRNLARHPRKSVNKKKTT